MFSEAQLYSDASFLQQRKAELMMEKYRSWLRFSPKDLVLDIGAGPGIITERLPSLLSEFRRIVGVDVSKDMVEHARKECNDSRISYHRMDITESDPSKLRHYLPPDLKGKTFDKVFCFYLLHWLAGKFQQALLNIESLLSAEGQGMAIQYISIPVFDTYTIVGKYKKWAAYLHGVTLDYNPLRTNKDPCGFMRSSMIEAGLHVDDVSSYSSHNVYHSMSDLIGLMTSIDPFLQFIPVELQAEYQEDFMAALLPKCILTSDGAIAIPFTIMTVAFSKK